MTQPAQIKSLLTSAAERQRAQREAMAGISQEIAEKRTQESRPDTAQTQAQQ